MAQIFGHGGFFKTPVVGQRFMAAAMGTPVTVMETQGLTSYYAEETGILVAY